MEWTREKTLQLIGAYRDRRGLWDMTCDDYRKKEVKQRLLSEVRTNLGGDIPIPELEKKFHTLRTQYHREISRMKRKEPYNSKWFGFKNLQFLSSPRACRSNKSRGKSEQADEGSTTVSKYIISDLSDNSAGDNSAGQTNHNDNEFISLAPRKGTTNRSAQELEKLIEETTKDVEDIEDAKPKLLMKEMNEPFQQSYTTEEVQVTESEHLENHNQTEHHHHHHQQQHQHHHHQTQAVTSATMEEVDQQTTTTIEAVSFQANENGELHFQSPSSGASSVHQHHHMVPARIFKLPRRETTAQDDNYYSPEGQHQTKRIFYDASPHNSTTTTILTAPALTTPSNGTPTIINPTALKLPRGTVCVNTAPQPPPKQLNESPNTSVSYMHQPARDEYSTYGEYVANELRTINNREVLTALKHKINTAIFEANMAELHK